MRNKILSVIIPVYNADKYIKECLESLSDFAIPGMEVLVVNDGSTDTTLEVVEACIKKDDKISVFSLPNGGVSRARNYGIDMAQGEFIMFLDADDYLIKESFDSLKSALSSDYDFTAFSRTIVEKNGKKWDDLFPFTGRVCEDKDVVDSYMFADSLFNECWGKLFKRSLINDYNLRFPVDIPIGEDTMFVTEYYSRCQRVILHNIPLVAYRQHDSSTMRKKSIEERLKYTDMLYEYAKRYIPEKVKNQSLYYNFKILTNLCREYSKGEINLKAIKTIYLSDICSKILKELNCSNIPMYRRHEYYLISHKKYLFSALYYRIKAMIT